MSSLGFRFASTFLIFCGLLASARAASNETLSLLDLDLESLTQVDVVTASLTSTPLVNTAAAVHVITAEDIRRSGASSLPDVLRLAPGVEVARISPSAWSVTIRGFAGQFANKLLVLVDGRSVYNTTFNGVYWDMLDVMLDDIERIEVVRGAGTVQWGSNAVNGVINIITRHAADTVGNLAKVSVGDYFSDLAFRHGRETASQNHLRAYAKADRSATFPIDSDDLLHEYERQSAGFRFDGNTRRGDQLQVIGSVLRMDQEQVTNFPVITTLDEDGQTIDDDLGVELVNASAEWTRSLKSGSELSFSAYLDYYHRDSATRRESNRVMDISTRFVSRPSLRHRVLLGAGIRQSRDRVEALLPVLTISPERATREVSNLMFQDEFEWIPDEVFLTWGSKLEHNSVTGNDWQHQLRALWRPASYASLWASASRATHPPSRVDGDSMSVITRSYVPIPLLPGNHPGILVARGNADDDTESLQSVELGFRLEPARGWLVDVSYYKNRYDNIYDLRLDDLTLEQGRYYLASMKLERGVHGNVQGVELFTRWKATPSWQFQLTGHRIDFDLQSRIEQPFSFIDFTGLHSSFSPEYQYAVSAHWSGPFGLNADVRWRHVEGIQFWPLKNLEPINNQADRYDALDLRLGWRVSEDMQLSLVGNNLLDAQHKEYVDDFWVTTFPVPRSIQLSGIWRF